MKISPYKVPGRWYKIFLESDGSEVVATTSDIPIEIAGNYITFPEDFHVMERLYDIHTIDNGSINTIAIDIIALADGRQAIQKPTPSAFDYGDIYILGHYEL